MSVIIRDGTGSERTSRVTQDNQLDVVATTLGFEERSIAVGGNVISLSTNITNLTTTGSFNGLLYIKNNASSPIVLWRVFVSSVQSAQWKITRKPTGGTLISDANAAVQWNRNLLSTKSLVGLAYSASANGKTVTGGTDIVSVVGCVGPQHLMTSLIVVGSGDELALQCKPSATSDVAASFLVSLLDLGGAIT